MAKRTFLVTVISTNILFILIMLHKRNAFTEQLFNKQRLENQLHTLTKQEHMLQHELSALQDRSTVKTYAQTYLNMQPITLTQLKKLPS